MALRAALRIKFPARHVKHRDANLDPALRATKQFLRNHPAYRSLRRRVRAKAKADLEADETLPSGYDDTFWAAVDVSTMRGIPNIALLALVRNFAFGCLGIPVANTQALSIALFDLLAAFGALQECMLAADELAMVRLLELLLDHNVEPGMLFQTIEAHLPAVAVIAVDAAKRTSADPRISELCRRYARGNCKAGLACRLSHRCVLCPNLHAHSMCAVPGKKPAAATQPVATEPGQPLVTQPQNQSSRGGYRRGGGRNRRNRYKNKRNQPRSQPQHPNRYQQPFGVPVYPPPQPYGFTAPPPFYNHDGYGQGRGRGRR